MTYQLLRCPFCGKLPDTEDPDTMHPSGVAWVDRGDLRTYCTIQDTPKEQWCWLINCPESSGGCSATIYGDSQEEVVEKWNNRRSHSAN